jgi:hypothetical protein
VRVLLRSCGFTEQYRDLSERLGVADIVEFGEFLPYEEALQEMVAADALLVFQGTEFNHAVPAKIYEYLFARRPMFAILDRTGETYRVLSELNVHSAASISDVDEIGERFWSFVDDVRHGRVPLPPRAVVDSYSRKAQTRKLGALLELAVSGAPTAESGAE